MDYVTLLGFVAATLTMTAFLPQVIQTWKTKSTKDISLGMFIIFCIGALTWLVYGILINALPVIITNIVLFILGVIILTFKIRYK
ncbi:MAG: SemiSWEET transporter [Candidatus Omnitrophica bacterium]|nr:SemiSWEET transporter [Candidatus Omnitrophota bacterium]